MTKIISNLCGTVPDLLLFLAAPMTPHKLLLQLIGVLLLSMHIAQAQFSESEHHVKSANPRVCLQCFRLQRSARRICSTCTRAATMRQ